MIAHGRAKAGKEETRYVRVDVVTTEKVWRERRGSGYVSQHGCTPHAPPFPSWAKGLSNTDFTPASSLPPEVGGGEGGPPNTAASGSHFPQ